MANTRFLIPGATHEEEIVVQVELRQAGGDAACVVLVDKFGDDYYLLRISADGIQLYEGVDGENTGVAVDEDGCVVVDPERLG